MNPLKKIIVFALRPLALKFLARDGEYTRGDTTLLVKKGVFHPGLYFSTEFLLEEIEKMPLKGKSFLELGCGSGLLSIVAAKRGARVVSSDINPEAISCTRINAEKNNVRLHLIESDVFARIPRQVFDIIVINPPFFPQEAKSTAEMAWYCGAHFEYFEKMFSQIGAFFVPESLVLMVLSQDCETDEIKRIAAKNGFVFRLRTSKRNWFERENIFEIRKAAA